jgi:hypothetical protein
MKKQRSNDSGNLLAGLLVAGIAYGVMQHPKCQEACQQFFGAANSQAGTIVASAAIALISTHLL